MRYEIALVGNPNTGKSSIFNALTGLKQHTGNWPGKTVSIATGEFIYNNEHFKVTDTPGTYSLLGLSDEEIVARDYVCFHNPHAIIVVCDATAMEKNLNLVFQTLEYNKNVIVVVNLVDEARRNGVRINRLGLEFELGVPVVFTSAKTKEGIDNLKEMILKVVTNNFNSRPISIKYEQLKHKQTKINNLITFTEDKDLLSLRILDSGNSFFKSYYQYHPENRIEIELIREGINTKDNRNIVLTKNLEISKSIVNKHIFYNQDSLKKTKQIDSYITSKLYGIPIMFILLFSVFYLTIKFANIPSDLLFKVFTYIENKLILVFNSLGLSGLSGFFIYGVYRTLSLVISVMLPPMAIFFVLFTFLEDLGYLPRVAYNLDHHFKRCGCHGKQSLSMCMGFGCNATGVMGTRIIDSKREKMIAIVTNTFVPCNGRFPLIFTLSSCFFVIFSSRFLNEIFPSLIASAIILIGIISTLLVSKALSKTLLKGEPSTFTLELPPYRVPNILRVLYSSLVDRTLLVLRRAILIAAPAGAFIYFLTNVYIKDASIFSHIANFIDPFGGLLGLDGIILLSFILALPANEIVLPIIIMAYSSSTHMMQIDSITGLKDILVMNNWTLFTAINVLLFSLLHFPCSTTILTIYHETKSKRWTLLSVLIPTIIAILVCFITNLIFTII